MSEQPPPPPVVVAVTGATGLVGRAVVERLVQSPRFNVVAIARNSAQLESMAGELRRAHGIDAASAKLTLKVSDINDRTALQEALTGAIVVVHAAGSVDPDGAREAVYKVNVEGTTNVLAAATACGLKQMIHISSLSVITGQSDQFDVDESAPLVLCGEVYADSKVEAEKRLAEAMKTGSISITILRPGFIYGPGERSWMPRVIDNIKHSRAVLVDGGQRQTNVIYVGNLAMAVESAILNSLAYGEVFNLTDGERVSKKLLFDEIAEGLSLPLVQRNLPRETIKPVFTFMQTIRPLFPRGMRAKLARFSPAAFRLVAVNQGFAIRKAEQLLDYKNRISFKEGMALTLKGFKN
ncbi:MAG: NAD-dependent epimerase/dehydratase family protein [Cyanobacteria bacterium SZAS TMP-1]|nr:NAD-dependent epimerase/dehydratase family protein [Cyanobacteria bacterium SZAS TMP-1]